MFIYIYIARKNLESVLLLIYAFGICSKRKLGNIRINFDNTRNFNAEFFTKSTNVFFGTAKCKLKPAMKTHL